MTATRLLIYSFIVGILVQLTFCTGYYLGQISFSDAGGAALIKCVELLGGKYDVRRRTGN